MKCQMLSLPALTSVLCFAALSAQDGVNFSGTWVKDPQQSESLAQAADVSAQAPRQLIIEQSPNAVRLTRQRLDGQTDTVTYPFNPPASASPPAATAAPGGSSGTTTADGTNVSLPATTRETDARAEWKDGGLTLLTSLLVNGKTVTTTERLTISPDGRQLTIETQLMMHHGYESIGSSPDTAPKPVRDLYTKAQQ
jgi:hypothetical protein